MIENRKYDISYERFGFHKTNEKFSLPSADFEWNPVDCATMSRIDRFAT